jgi:hypothetical protein
MGDCPLIFPLLSTEESETEKTCLRECLEKSFEPNDIDEALAYAAWRAEEI